MNLVELAQRIKRLRQERQMTLEQAAAQMGFTRSWLSKVENFRVTPSLPALSQIAGALGVTVASLVEGLDERPRIVLVRPSERAVVERDQGISAILYESLAYKRPDRSMDPFVLTLPPGQGRDEPLPHEGEEFLYVLDGETDFEYDGQNFTLDRGDALYFDATVPHRLINRSRVSATVLCVFLANKPEPADAPRSGTLTPSQ